MYFSVFERERLLQVVQQETYDVIVIGGGITGAGVALDAVTRGLSVLLLEMQDFAEGTSSRSTKLVHGGLRYLKQLEVREVAELGRERAIVYENGPHVTTPVWMLLPFHKGGTFERFTTSLGLKVYDVLAGVKKEERRFMLSRDQTIEHEPLVKTDGLLGGGVYVEYLTDDARLTIEVLKAAIEKGATAFNYMKVVGLQTKNVAYTAVEALNQLTGETHYFKAKKIINAAGPWVDHVRKLDGELANKHMILSKGVHLVFDQSVFPLQQAIYFDTEHDGRMIFAIPRAGKTYVGTTDTFYEGDPLQLTVTEEDKTYIIEAIHYMFPTLSITKEDIESSWAGVRPLIHEEGKGPSEISRKDEIWQSNSGVITIAGGKLTGYRKMAENIVDLVVKQLAKEYNLTFRPCITKKLPISGGEISGSKHFDTFFERKVEQAMQYGLTEQQTGQMVRFYGTNIDRLLSFVQPHAEMPPYLFAQLQYALHYESVAKPVDFFVRRTGYVFFDLPLVEQYADAVVQEMARQLLWTDQQMHKEQEHLQDAIQLAKTT